MIGAVRFELTPTASKAVQLTCYSKAPMSWTITLRPPTNKLRSVKIKNSYRIFQLGSPFPVGVAKPIVLFAANARLKNCISVTFYAILSVPYGI